MGNPDTEVIHIPNANSRHTLFSVHNVRAAHQYTKGEGIDVGIIDHLFATELHGELYETGTDFVDRPESLHSEDGHGYWMACVLKEIAPGCRLHALNVAHRDSARFSEAIVAAIEWSIANDIRVLTCSHGQYAYNGLRAEVDAAVSRAVGRGIVTCFLHYDHEDNILPDGVFPWNGRQYSRQPDLNIWHYEYNTLLLDKYRAWSEATEPPRSGDEIPYFSMSSTAAATGGFVALLMALNPRLIPHQYRQVLIDTSYRWSYEGEATFETGEAPHVVDIESAVKRVSGGDLGT